MALNTIDTYLLQGTDAGTPPTRTYAKIVDIKDYSDIFGEKEQLDCTTLSDKAFKYIAGLQSGDPITFTCNFTYTDFNAVKTLDDGTVKHIRIAFGKSGSTYGTDCAFDFDGFVSASVIGKGVNEVREFQITIIVNSEISYSQVSA